MRRRGADPPVPSRGNAPGLQLARLAERLRRLAASRRTEAALLEAEAEMLEATESAPPNGPEPLFVTPKNCLDILGKRFSALDGWLRRRGVERLKVAGSPAYRLADVRRAVEQGNAPRESAPGLEDDPDVVYATLVAAQAARKARAGR